MTKNRIEHPQSLAQFWPKRFMLVGIPYVCWTAIYVVINTYRLSPDHSTAVLVTRFANALLHGNASEQLYFLLVTMQLYLLMPAVAAVLRRFPAAGPTLLVVAFVGQVVITSLVQYDLTQVAGRLGMPSGDVMTWTQLALPTAGFFIVVGAVAGTRSDAFWRWVRAHRTAIGAFVLASAFGTTACFAVQVRLGATTGHASAALQPIEILWTIAAILALARAGAHWAARRQPGSLLDRCVAWASDRSFGIFLSHAAWINLLIDLNITALPPVVRTPIGYACVLLGAALTTEVLRRTPLSLPLTGRPMLRRGRASSRAQAHAGDRAEFGRLPQTSRSGLRR